MLVLIHVLSALGSLGLASWQALRPTQMLLRVTYGLMAATLASGVYLIWITRAPMLATCLSGVAYLTVLLVLLARARFVLASQALADTSE